MSLLLMDWNVNGLKMLFLTEAVIVKNKMRKCGDWCQDHQEGLSESDNGR